MCGLVGAFHINEGRLDDVVEAMAKLNNRGHEAVGLAASDGITIMPYRRQGYVRDACTDQVNQWRSWASKAVKMRCNRIIGHLRYSTVGELIQPIRMISLRFGEFYFAHNGQYPFHEQLRKQLGSRGHRFHTESDSEVLAAYVASLDVPTLSEAVMKLVEHVEGAFSVLALSNTEMVAARDRYGIRPLWYYKDDDGIFFASETGGLPNSSHAKKIAPGSVVVVTESSDSIDVATHQVISSCLSAHCIFEVLYFSRPDQRIGGSDAAAIRRMLGKVLARHAPVNADIVFAVPDSGIPSAIGFAEESRLRYEPSAIVRNYHSVRGRSFILPGVANRSAAAQRKYSVSSATVCGKRVVVVDDTSVRVLTIPIIVKMLFDAGAIEVHVRIPAAPVVDTCCLGVDMKSRDELPASCASEDEINEQLVRATSFRYLPLEQMLLTCSAFHEGWCSGCFGGEYPIDCSSIH